MAKLKKTPSKKNAVLGKSAAKKKSKGKNDSAVHLHQSFLNSLTTLEDYWRKKVSSLTKELTTLREKNAKSTPRKQITSSKEIIQEKREELTSAKQSLSKYSALKKLITQFERDWKKKSLEDNQTKKEPTKPKEKPKSRVPIAPPALQAQEMNSILEKEILTERIEEDLEDIFMPQDDLAEFEVIEDFGPELEEDDYDEYSQND